MIPLLLWHGKKGSVTTVAILARYGLQVSCSFAGSQDPASDTWSMSDMNV